MSVFFDSEYRLEVSMKKIKLTYIGGGSKLWARVFMNDLALTEGLSGEIALYDIDIEAARRNRKIGERINAHPDTVSRWDYVVYEDLESALSGADFVACSILPGTFDQMAVDVHAPEKYGIWQSVGDTAGPGGILRAMRTVPIYEGFAGAIQKCCPDAWVINLTNPMTMCCRTLFDTFPGIKAFGCCHEVFNAEDFLCCVISEQLGVPRPDRHELVIDASGINHFTWITEARWQDVDVLSLLPGFMEKYFDKGYDEKPGFPPDGFNTDPFHYGNRVKMDLFRKYGVLAAAGDRHLVEFLPNSQYLAGPETVDKWLFHLTTVDYRRADQKRKIAELEAIAAGELSARPHKSAEELIQLMKAILGFGTVVSNANTPNRGQMRDLPLGAVVEVNHVFDNNCVRPIVANPLPAPVMDLLRPCVESLELCYQGIKTRDLNLIFEAFMAQPMVCDLSRSDGERLFREMVEGTRAYLDPYYQI